ncbi:3'(2'),5'-bisphosphate nucleotidase CysQ [Asticcacaulis sp. AC402]|uniref:inositol monophosphatase family protein n=1 Tax=Asticcacaulis sp. AC402 TaxID=1282361 RepID=UPI0003C3EF36|nr:3'(2'),5'-bisphosphate nucleotidase CysQ [Asticcacaulis sp. AC402]ESQ73816.1 inositol monophosphatase [Asticcacaulis sp. AC402]
MATAVQASDLDLIVDKVRRAGALAQHLKAHGLITSYKADGSIVTNADTEVNLWLKEALEEARPDYGWQSEESPDDTRRLGTKRTFVLDPIDGTMGLSKGSPFWTIALAVVEDGKPVAAVVYAPDAGEMFSAAVGRGARLNDAPIHVTDRTALDDAEVLGDSRLFGKDIWPIPWPRLSVHSRPSVAYRMACVACGRADFTIALTPKRDWDVAAATLIAQEAGATVTDHLGNPYEFNAIDSLKPSLICSGPALFPEIIRRCAHLSAL